MTFGTASSQKELLSELMTDANESTTGSFPLKINIKQSLFRQWLGDGPDAWDVSTARQENNGTPTNGAHNIIQNTHQWLDHGTHNIIHRWHWHTQYNTEHSPIATQYKTEEPTIANTI